MAWYKTGTVAVTNGSTTVTGTGTNFVSGAQVGEAFQGPDGELYEITAISSATSLTLGSSYGGSTASGQSYAIVPTQSLVADLATDVSTLISDYQDIADNAGAGKFADGSAAAPGITFSQDQDTGFFRDTANEIAVSIGGTKIGEFNSSGANFTGAVDIDTSLNVDGTATLDGLTVAGDVAVTDNLPTITLTDTDNSNSRTDIHYNYGYLDIDVDANQVDAAEAFRVQIGGTKHLAVETGGDVAFYDAAGSNKRFFWDASTERLGLGTDSPTYSLHLYGADNQQVTLESTDGTVNVGFKDSDTTQISQVGAKGNDLYFATGGSETARLTDDGDLGLGVAAPASRLDVAGTTTTDGLTLDAISDTIQDTAVDVFIYDTRKDSDGGAWRKRTQHTSWYNETLNTSTRGSRKEFPAVAVIVAENGTVTIYDGDDPDLPMWMVFNSDSWTGGVPTRASTSGNTTAIHMLNGYFCITSGGTTASGLSTANFVSDVTEFITGTGFNYTFNKSIVSLRNVVVTPSAASGLPSYALVDSECNDVAMTVLPNAPIDATTGLPVPTIAVATVAGVSVIKDDGTVVDLTRSGSPMATVDFHDGYLIFGSSSVGAVWYYDYIPSSDEAVSPNDGHVEYYDSGFSNKASPSYLGYTNTIAAGSYVGTTGNNDSGLTAVNFNATDYTKSSTAYITSSYNTGWMNGDIKLATLSDTDDTNLTGSELVTNGDFASATGWTTNTDYTISGGKLQYAYSAAGGRETYQTIPSSSLTSGKRYRFSVDIEAASGVTFGVYTTGAADSAGVQSYHSSGTIAVEFTASSGDVDVRIRNASNSSGDTGTLDNASVRLVEPDRSVAGNGLQVFGTVTKSAVATGADLMAYSGFDNNSNYLEQPYNSDLDFGTGDFSMMAWVKPTTSGANARFMCREDGVNSNKRILFFIGSSDRPVIYAGAANFTASTTLNMNTWTHLVGVRRSGVLYVYINGVQDPTTASATSDLTDSDAKVRLGRGVQYGSTSDFSMALARISATAPSPEQIKKIYEDEKVLFQEGAQATLYGSSDAVTALAYDDSTNLLHVGTSAGRSVFQGLRRVDNTTTGVSAAIAASNGLVADE